MKKLVSAKLSLAAFAAAFAIVTTGCDANVNLNVTNDKAADSKSSVSSSVNKDAGSGEAAGKKEAEEKENDAEEAPAENEKAAEDEASEEKEAEVTEAEEEAPAEEAGKDDSAVEIKEDGTAVVLEDGIRYGRMTLENHSKYKMYSADEMEKVNADLKTIQHDAVARYGNWQKSSTEEQQGDGVSFVSFREIGGESGYLKGAWAIDLGNPQGEIYYDANTLEPLTVDQFFTSEWAANNTGSTQDDLSGSDVLIGKIAGYYDDGKVQISYDNDWLGIHVEVLRDYINPVYVGPINGSAK